MNKPQPIRHVLVTWVGESRRAIHLDATDEAWEDFKQFASWETSLGISRMMSVSGLYDFQEVLNYIKEWQPAILLAWEDALESKE